MGPSAYTSFLSKWLQYFFREKEGGENKLKTMRTEKSSIIEKCNQGWKEH